MSNNIRKYRVKNETPVQLPSVRHLTLLRPWPTSVCASEAMTLSQLVPREYEDGGKIEISYEHSGCRTAVGQTEVGRPVAAVTRMPKLGRRKTELGRV